MRAAADELAPHGAGAVEVLRYGEGVIDPPTTVVRVEATHPSRLGWSSAEARHTAGRPSGRARVDGRDGARDGLGAAPDGHSRPTDAGGDRAGLAGDAESSRRRPPSPASAGRARRPAPHRFHVKHRPPHPGRPGHPASATEVSPPSGTPARTVPVSRETSSPEATTGSSPRVTAAPVSRETAPPETGSTPTPSQGHACEPAPRPLRASAGRRPRTGRRLRLRPAPGSRHAVPDGRRARRPRPGARTSRRRWPGRSSTRCWSARAAG